MNSNVFVCVKPVSVTATSSKSYTVLPGYCGWVLGICVCVLIECGFHCSELSLVHPWCCFGCWYWFVCLMPIASCSVCVGGGFGVTALHL